MSIKLRFRPVGDVTVIDAEGMITLGEGTNAFRNAIETLVFGRMLTDPERHGQTAKPAGQAAKILVNLGEVSFIDSTGLGELISGLVIVTSQRGQLQLLNLTERVHDTLFNITKVGFAFSVHKEEGKAIVSFGTCPHCRRLF